MKWEEIFFDKVGCALLFEGFIVAILAVLFSIELIPYFVIMIVVFAMAFTFMYGIVKQAKEKADEHEKKETK